LKDVACIILLLYSTTMLLKLKSKYISKSSKDKLGKQFKGSPLI